MIRTIFRNDSMWFGPLRDNDLAVIAREPVFAGHGVRVSASPQSVEVYVTMPADLNRVQRVQNWFLHNHKILS